MREYAHRELRHVSRQFGQWPVFAHPEPGTFRSANLGRVRSSIITPQANDLQTLERWLSPNLNMIARSPGIGLNGSRPVGYLRRSSILLRGRSERRALDTHSDQQSSSERGNRVSLVHRERPRREGSCDPRLDGTRRVPHRQAIPASSDEIVCGRRPRPQMGSSDRSSRATGKLCKIDDL